MLKVANMEELENIKVIYDIFNILRICKTGSLNCILIDV
jgi:hypothetical protein